MNFQPLLEKIRNWWETSDRTQKIISISGSLILIVLVAGAAFMASRPKMEPIFPGATPSEQGIVRDAVLGYGMAAEINSRGDVMVPADKSPDIKIRLSQEGKLPSSPGTGVGDPVAQNSFFQTPAQQDQELKAKKETELAKSIMTLSGVKAAIVHINFGKDSPFGDQKLPPSAVVNITEQPGMSLTQSQSSAIARLIQNSIAGLEAKGVSVIDSQGRILYDGEEINSEDAMATRKLEAERDESRRREKELQKRLDLAFGPMATLAQVQVELNMDDVEVEETRRTPSQSPEAKDTVSEELSGGPGGINGVGGIDANPPAQPAAAARTGETGNYKSETSSERFSTDTRHTVTKKAAGQVESLNVAVLVDTTKVEDLDAVQQFVDGILATRGDRNFTSAVVPTTFSSAVTELQQKTAADAASAQRMQQLMSILPILALLGVAFMLMRALTKSNTPPVSPKTTEALPAGSLALPGGSHADLALPNLGSGQGYELAGVTGADAPHESSSPLLVEKEPEYDLSGLDDIDMSGFSMTESNPYRPQNEGMVNDLREQISRIGEPDETLPPEVREIREKVDVPLERIRRLAKERPETVATLLKSWLMEDH
jgi:flagellar M-ring protein FliF